MFDTAVERTLACRSSREIGPEPLQQEDINRPAFKKLQSLASDSFPRPSLLPELHATHKRIRNDTEDDSRKKSRLDIPNLLNDTSASSNMSLNEVPVASMYGCEFSSTSVKIEAENPVYTSYGMQLSDAPYTSSIWPTLVQTGMEPTRLIDASTGVFSAHTIVPAFPYATWQSDWPTHQTIPPLNPYSVDISQSIPPLPFVSGTYECPESDFQEPVGSSRSIMRSSRNLQSTLYAPIAPRLPECSYPYQDSTV
jgi:hypothetical protein